MSSLSSLLIRWYPFSQLTHLIVYPFLQPTSSPSKSVNAVEDTAQTPIGTPVIINVLDNDKYPEGVTVTVTIIESSVRALTATTQAQGTCEVVDNKVQYTPNAGYSGKGVCHYEVCVFPPGSCDRTNVYINVGTVSNDDDNIEDEEDEDNDDEKNVISSIARRRLRSNPSSYVESIGVVRRSEEQRKELRTCINWGIGIEHESMLVHRNINGLEEYAIDTKKLMQVSLYGMLSTQPATKTYISLPSSLGVTCLGMEWYMG